MSETTIDAGILDRARGCLLGQCVGDALGQMVEFRSAEQILERYPNGIRDMADGGAFNTIAGQPTDDTELALMLARSIAKAGRFDAEKVFAAYRFWFASGPFDCGFTTSSALNGRLNHDSQANGSLMRISPLGVFGANYPLQDVADWAMQDARLTHPNIVCQKAAAIYATTIAEAVRAGLDAEDLYENALDRARTEFYFEPSVLERLEWAAEKTPDNFSRNAGWVLIALQNAFYQLLHAESLEEGLIDTVNRGGDTDTNGAICGALLGAVHGVKAFPNRWRDTVLNCRPVKNDPRVRHPRPECFWPIDIFHLAEELLSIH